MMQVNLSAASGADTRENAELYALRFWEKTSINACPELRYQEQTLLDLEKYLIRMNIRDISASCSTSV